MISVCSALFLHSPTYVEDKDNLRIITICNFTFHYDVSWYDIHVMLSTYFEVKLYDNSVL